MIQNESINEHKLHFKTSMPNGLWIKNDRSFRLEKMGVLSRMLSSRSRKGLVYRQTQFIFTRNRSRFFSADRPTSILRSISLQKSLMYGLGGCRAGKSGNLAAHICQEK